VCDSNRGGVPKSKKALPEQQVTAHDNASPRRPRKGLFETVILSDAVVEVVVFRTLSVTWSLLASADQII
jgi:hypothetical protein